MRPAGVATIGGPLGRFNARDENLSEYVFDWNTAEEAQLRGIEGDVLSFSRFAASVTSVANVDVDRLAKLPHLRRVFAAGLGETYQFTTPEVAAVIHKLNGRDAAARSALDIARRSEGKRRSLEEVAALRGFVSGA